MNPRRLNIHVKAYEQEMQRRITYDNAIAHLQGRYICDSLMATVCNMFTGKNSKPFEYPETPYEMNGGSTELTETEKQRQRELFVAQYMTMMANFNLGKDDDKGQEQ